MPDSSKRRALGHRGIGVKAKSKGRREASCFQRQLVRSGRFCKLAGKRLPTEAEWGKAVRGGRDRKPYAWVDNDREPDERVSGAINRGKAMAVGSFPPNGYALFDMIGNVMEWTCVPVRYEQRTSDSFSRICA